VDIQELNRQVVEQFRANGGRMVEGPLAGAPLLLLSTTGAKSGEPRLNPLAYLRDGDRLVIIASYAGAPSSPPWYHNLRAHPEVGVEVGTEKFRARASVVPEPERTRLYARMADIMPVFADYAKRTSRVIPVIALTRIPG
jgi:deazaflavin-dependent oxidoreductase (nitroreductase family)